MTNNTNKHPGAVLCEECKHHRFAGGHHEIPTLECVAGYQADQPGQWPFNPSCPGFEEDPTPREPIDAATH